jgi:hypothetical protein
MKKQIIYLIGIALACVSCDDDLKNAKPDLPAGGTVENILVSPTSRTIYVDSDLPTMKYVCVPNNAKDTTVTWKSDKPEVIQVESDGKLVWGTPANATVTITAVSNENGVSGSCVLTVKNYLNKYRYIDARALTGLWILDRNVGASTPQSGGNLKTSAGNYYHFGLNSPAANLEFGGPDGKGGDYHPAGMDATYYVVRGGYPAFDDKWNADGPNFKDWSNPNNVPGLSGWRLPTKAECEKIAYATNPQNFKGAKDKIKAQLLREKLGLLVTGKSEVTGIWNSDYGYLWSSDWDPSTKKVWCLVFYQETSSPLTVEAIPIKDGRHAIALPMRLVRSAESSPQN